MIKFVALGNQGKVYGFGLTEADLNRMEFNNEAVFFDFGYAGNPEQFGVILCLSEFAEPIDIAQNMDALEQYAIPFLDANRGVTPNTLSFFPLARSVMKKFREVPFWGFETNVQIGSPGDIQLFFAGPDQQAIEQYFKQTGFITPKTKRTYRGFGRAE